MMPLWPLIILATAGAVVGTAFGARILEALPQRLFRRMVAGLLLILAFYMIVFGRR
jgi:uncharacterized membrane protein YfcA